MASEIQIDLSVSGKTVYFLLRSSTGTIWNGASLVAYVSANYATYPITGTEQGTSGFYTGAMPAVAAGVYSASAKIQAGGSAAETDNTAGMGDLYWDGTIVQFLPTNFGSTAITSAGRVSIQTRFNKNTALNNFEFFMVKSSDGTTPATGLTITSQRSIDGAAFVATTNTATELSNGMYVINLSAADLNGGVITLRFSATGALDRDVTIGTDP